jgi:SAM-dependent methyltransferase
MVFGLTMSQSPDGAPSAAYELDERVLRQSMLENLPKRLFGWSVLRLPAAPALLDHYVALLGKLFALHGRAFSPEELEHLRSLLAPLLEEGFAAARNSSVMAKYQTDEPPKATISYTFTLEASSLVEEYQRWANANTAPFFGQHPDRKVLDLARSLGTPAALPVLDVGAGTGRNALALARAGFPTDAVELSPDFVAMLRESVEKQGLSLRLFEGDILEGVTELPSAHYGLVIASGVVSDFRDVRGLERWFERAAALVRPGGMLLFNAFIAVSGYEPDLLARQLAAMCWSTLFLRDEVRAAASAHGFALLAEESAADYEKAHSPANTWPPTTWFEEWARGLEAFDLPLQRAPVELRWFTFRKKA